MVMRETGNLSGQPMVSSNLGTIAYDRRDFHLALCLHKEAQQIDSEIGGCQDKAKDRVNIGLINQLITGWDG
jgi:hypothetical protein